MTPNLSDFGVHDEQRVSGYRAWPPAAGNAAGCGLGCFAVVLLQALALPFLIRGFFRSLPPETLEVSVRAPRVVEAGRDFPLELVVRNDGTEPVNISNVTPARSLTDALELKDPTPAPAATTSFGGTTAWTYQHQVAPHTEWRVRWTARARRAGAVRAALNVQAPFIPKPVVVKLDVREPRAPPAAKPAASGR